MDASWSLEDRDAHMLRQAKSDGMCESDRRNLWAVMFRHSPERQKDFIREENYSAFMEGCFRGVVGGFGNGRAHTIREDSVTEEYDQIALDVAKAKGWRESNRRDLWSSVWGQSPERQREFSHKDHYVAFMEASFRRMK